VKAKLREDRCATVAANETWAMDFVHDQLATGRKLRVLTIVGTWSRFSPAVDPRFSYRAGDVVATLDRVCAEGFPTYGFKRHLRLELGAVLLSFASQAVRPRTRCRQAP
jgi:putative transposase